MPLQTDIDALFDRYLTAWNARDFDGVAACYTYPCLFVLPQASIPVADADAMVSLLTGLFAGLEENGFSHTEIGAVSATSCGDGLAVVDATDVRRLRHDGSVLEIIDGHYIARKEADGWRFNLAVSCTPGWNAA